MIQFKTAWGPSTEPQNRTHRAEENRRSGCRDEVCEAFSFFLAGQSADSVNNNNNNNSSSSGIRNASICGCALEHKTSVALLYLEFNRFYGRIRFQLAVLGVNDVNKRGADEKRRVLSFSRSLGVSSHRECSSHVSEASQCGHVVSRRLSQHHHHQLSPQTPQTTE